MPVIGCADPHSPSRQQEKNQRHRVGQEESDTFRLVVARNLDQRCRHAETDGKCSRNASGASDRNAREMVTLGCHLSLASRRMHPTVLLRHRGGHPAARHHGLPVSSADITGSSPLRNEETGARHRKAKVDISTVQAKPTLALGAAPHLDRRPSTACRRAAGRPRQVNPRRRPRSGGESGNAGLTHRSLSLWGGQPARWVLS